MDLSDSPGLSENQNLAKRFLQHAQYVAASRVATLEGLPNYIMEAQKLSV